MLEQVRGWDAGKLVFTPFQRTKGRLLKRAWNKGLHLGGMAFQKPSRRVADCELVGATFLFMLKTYGKRKEANSFGDLRPPMVPFWFQGYPVKSTGCFSVCCAVEWYDSFWSL